MSASSDSCYSITSRSENHEDHAAEGGNENEVVSQQAKSKELKEVKVENEALAAAEIQAPQSVPNKRKRERKNATAILRFEVWDHFDKYDRDLFTVQEDGKKVKCGIEKRARCRHCKADLKADSSFNGTSTLRRHVFNACKKFPGNENLEDSQRLLIGDDALVPVLTQQKGWSNDACIKAACEMIFIDELLPFSHIENEGFRRFCKVVVPRFVPPSRRTIVRSFLEMYEEKKDELRKALRNRSVCLTTDTWTSIQNINYMVVMAHFIDDGWTLHKRILNFCVIPNHQGITIGKLLETCLLRWRIDKVLTISVDDASANKVAIEYLQKKMAGWRNPPVFSGKFLHVRCLAHILNIIVRAGLWTMDS